MRLLLPCIACLSAAALAQSTTPQPVIGSAGYSSPVPVSVAPGQLLTLFLQSLSVPAGPSGVSVVFHQGSDIPMPVLGIHPIAACSVPGVACAATVIGVTVQVPFGIQTVCPPCANPVALPPANITASVGGVSSVPLGVQPLQNQVHFLTQCDVIVPGSLISFSNGGLPCLPLVTHADGTPVNAAKPAKSGEELVAYATGLGQTNPPQTTGQPAKQRAPTQTVFGIDFNYRPNALATKPAPVSATPGFTGATAGFIGLYQINFTVPPAPAGLPPCADPVTSAPFANIVQSNLTVSIGSSFSFDGAGICVQPGS